MTGQLRAGILFDVDGTLADTDYLHALAWSRALRDAGEWAPMNAIHRLLEAWEAISSSPSCSATTVLRRSRPGRTVQRVAREVQIFSVLENCCGGRTKRQWRWSLATSAPKDELSHLLKLLTPTR